MTQRRQHIIWPPPRHKVGVSLSFGDREHPLEGDLDADMDLIDPLVGKTVEVSEIAGSGLHKYRGKKAIVDGVIYRFGKPVAYRVKIDGGPNITGSAKDFYLDRCVVENAQPDTAISMAVREGLSHWATQRDYWHNDLSGLEAQMFALASVTPQAVVEVKDWGWEIFVPDMMLLDYTHIRCNAYQHNSYWSLSTMVNPARGSSVPISGVVQDHWQRTFLWTEAVASRLEAQGWPWQEALQKLRARMQASSEILSPLVAKALRECLAARKQVDGGIPEMLPVYAGFSSVRLKAGTVGLTEPPSDRRPYTVISVAFSAMEDPDYLWQVVLHECVHIVVASNGGPPHNDLFMKISDIVGLEERYRR